MSKIKFIACVNEKGGVGKTTTVLHIAQAFVDLGTKVIVIDGDRLHAARKWSKARELELSFPVMSAEESLSYQGEKEIVIFDTAGGIEEAQVQDLTKFVNFFILPTQASRFDFTPTVNTAKKFLKDNLKFRLLINKSYGNNARAEQLKSYLESENIPVFERIIPRSSKIDDAIDIGRTVSEISGGRTIGDYYIAIAKQILTDLGESNA